MVGYELCGGYWWVSLLVMFVLCIVIMRGCMGRRMCGWRTASGFGESAMDVLNKRYVKGEIDKREYEEKKRELGSE